MRRLPLTVISGVAILATLFVFVLRDSSSAGAVGNSDVIEADQGIVGPGFARHPLLIRTHGRDAAGNPAVTNATPSGYTPAQMKAYLGLTGTGSGQTIAIVDAYDDPNITSDLNVFSSQWGLPLVCGTSGAAPAPICLNFTKATPQGLPGGNSGWALEISLDVEWAHAIAPAANILLVEAATNGFSNLMSAIDYAGKQTGVVVVSNSWGAGEFNGETTYDSHCQLSTAVCVFSTGDSGNPGTYPAYNPSVVAVGGTTLNLTSAGAVTSETAWSSSGGGVSVYESKPSYQATVNSKTMRGIPDVSYDADPGTGFPVYDTVAYSGQTGWFQVGGTSAGAPQWSAIIAAADQLRLASSLGLLTALNLQANTAIYTLNGTVDIYDVTSGSNGSCGSVCTTTTGYDFVTGIGSPRSGVDQGLAGASAPSPTPTNTPSVTSTPTATPTATNTPSPTNTPSGSCPPGQHKRGVC